MFKQKSKVFKDINGRELTVFNRKHSVVIEGRDIPEGVFRVDYVFTPEVYEEFTGFIRHIAENTWDNIKPIEATSFGSDYAEYYDRPLDNNGYLSVKGTKISLERPSLESVRMYQFSKKKVQAFIYDFCNNI